MNRKKIRRYMISVLAYYRSEWTDIPDDDKKFRLVATRSLEELLMSCMRGGTSVPDAAKQVQIFLSTAAQDCGVCEERPDEDLGPQREADDDASKPE